MAVIEGVQPGERKAMKNAIIKYILSTTAKKLPFKNIDIVKQCLRGEQKWFIHLYPEIEETLSDVYGLQIHEVKEKTGKLYLVTSEQHAGSEAEYTAEERVHLRLRLLVLSYIFMKGGQVLEPALFGFLRRLGIEEEPDEYFGEFKKYIGETFVKQLYLKKEKVEMETGHQEERFQYSWGHRADFECNKRDCLEFVAQIMNRPIESFTKQMDECLSDTEDVEIAQ